MLKMPRPVELGDSMQVFVAAIKDEYSILEKRLNEPNQTYVALPDRPTIADFAILPLANADVAATADIDFSEWPKLTEWSKRMYGLPYVASAIARVTRFGVTEEQQ
jgi:glutathione S-transferase